MSYDKNTSPRFKNIVQKLPPGTSLTLTKLTMSEANSPLKRTIFLNGSPPLKRKRSSSTSAPDIRRKLLEKSVEQKLDSVSILSENAGSIKKTPLHDLADEVFSVSLDEIYICPDDDDDEGKPKSNEDQSKKEIEQFKQYQPNQVSTPENPRSPKLSQEWIQISRSKRKSRFYIIRATGEQEDFIAVHKASDHTKIPACINGRRPFKVITGVEYGLEEDLGEDCGDVKSDEKEIKKIEKENYLLDSFVCDIGYLSDDELNETPSNDKIVSRVKQLRRANNIREKKKFELLSEPLVSGPFWWKGGGGCKKEVKKWQSIIFSTTPIPTSFTRTVPAELMEEEVENIPEVPSREASREVTVSVGAEEEYEAKYHIKYLVKFLVQDRMRGRRAVVSPQDCSTPLVRRSVSTTTQVSVTKDELLKKVSQHQDNILRNHPETVRKYVTKYYNKFSYQ